MRVAAMQESTGIPATARALGGLHEACFGVPDLAQAAEYWSAFGFRPDVRGELDRRGAEALYGIPSAVSSLRLRHLDSDHGLVRLMRWQRPIGPGVGATGLRLHGGRWVAQFVRSTLEASNHAELARRAGASVLEASPSFIDLTSLNPGLYGGRAARPFRDRLMALRELTLIQPLWRQALLERFGYDSALLGRIDDTALLRASQVTNASFMIRSDDAQVFSFYERTLGLRCSSVQEITWDRAMASRKAFSLREGETHWCYTFDEPRSGGTMDTSRSGRLYLFRFPSSSALDDRLAESQPGHLGCTLFTWRVGDAAAMRALCEEDGCANVTPLTVDEFGVVAFSCTTPDGMTWTFQQASEDERGSLAA